MRMIPWAEVKAEWAQEPGYAEAYAQAKREFDEEIEKYGTIGNPKPQPRLAAPARSTVKRKPHGFSARLKRARVTA